MGNNIVLDLENAILNPSQNLLYFEDENFEKPHYYIIIPTNDKENIIMLTMFTSQIQKRKEFYKNDDIALKSLFYIKEQDFDFLTKDSLIDCNKIYLKTKQEILKCKKLKIIQTNLSFDFFKNITNKILSSKKHKPRIKKKIDLSIISN